MDTKELDLNKLYAPIWEIEQKLAVANKALSKIVEDAFNNEDSDADALRGIQRMVDESLKETRNLDEYIRETLGPL